MRPDRASRSPGRGCLTARLYPRQKGAEVCQVSGIVTERVDLIDVRECVNVALDETINQRVWT